MIDGALDLIRHKVAAVGIGAHGQGLLLEAAQARGVARAHVAIEGLLVLQARRGRAGRSRLERRALGLGGERVEHALLLVQRAVDAIDAVGGDDVGGHAGLDLVEAGVVGLLEGLEGAHELVEGGSGAAGLGLKGGMGSSSDGRHGLSLRLGWARGWG